MAPGRSARGHFLDCAIETQDGHIAGAAIARGSGVVGGAAAGAGLRRHAPDRIARAWQTFDRGDWAWEYLRRNRSYQNDCRAATPRTLPCVTLRDGTALVRLRRRYPHAERWGLLAFTDPSRPTRTAPVFWMPAVSRRVVHARCDMASDRSRMMRLAQFRAQRSAVIGVDHVPVVAIGGPGFNVGLVAHGWYVLTRPAALTFELDGFDELGTRIECLQLLQRLAKSRALPRARRSTRTTNERLFQALTALDGSLAGRSYREIATTIFGRKRVAQDWDAPSRYLKDRTRRLVAKGHELMNGGYRNLLS